MTQLYWQYMERRPPVTSTRLAWKLPRIRPVLRLSPMCTSLSVMLKEALVDLGERRSTVPLMRVLTIWTPGAWIRRLPLTVLSRITVLAAVMVMGPV